MDRLEIINRLIEKKGYTSYCELGVFTGYTLDGCIASEKIGVDPNLDHYKGSNKTFKGTSDEFFYNLEKEKTYSIFFIDGDHNSEQVYKDICNALRALEPGGILVLHDVNPPLYKHTTTGIEGCWTGDVYKAVIKAKMLLPINLYTIDTDWGVGIITVKPKGLHSSPHSHIPSWEEFNINRKDYINLISVEQFIEKTK